MSAEMMEMKESQEAQRNQELLERSNRVMDGAVQLLAELDGVSEADVRERLAEEVSRPTELQQFMEMELERVKENLRASPEGGKSAQVSFGQSVEIRCKTTDVKNAVANNNEIAAKNRAKELARMMENERKKEEEKKAKQEQERQERERQEQQKKAK